MTNKKDENLAGILSFLVVGLGQVYCGKVWRGIGLCVLTIIGYCLFIVPGIALHIVVIWDAHEIAKKLNEK